MLATNPETDEDFPELVIRDRDFLAGLQRCPDEQARLGYLGDCLLFGFGGGSLSALGPHQVMRHGARAARGGSWARMEVGS